MIQNFLNGLFEGISEVAPGVGDYLAESNRQRKIEQQQAMLNALKERQQRAENEIKAKLQAEKDEEATRRWNAEFDLKKAEFNAKYPNFQAVANHGGQPGEILLSPEEEEKKKHVGNALIYSDINKRPIEAATSKKQSTLGEFAPGGYKLARKIISEINKSNSLGPIAKTFSRYGFTGLNNQLGLPSVPGNLSDIKDVTSFAKHIDEVVNSDFYQNLLEEYLDENKENLNIKTEADRKDFQELFRSYLVTSLTDSVLTTDQLKNIFGTSSDIETNLKNNLIGFEAVFSENPKESLREFFKKLYSKEKNPISPEDFERIAKTYFEKPEEDDIQSQLLAINGIPKTSDVVPQAPMPMNDQGGNPPMPINDQGGNPPIPMNDQGGNPGMPTLEEYEQFNQSLNPEFYRAKDTIEGAIEVAAEPLRKIANGLSKLMGKDWFKEPEIAAAFKKKYPISSLITTIPGEVAVSLGIGGAFAKLGNLIKAGVSEKFLANVLAYDILGAGVQGAIAENKSGTLKGAEKGAENEIWRSLLGRGAFEGLALTGRGIAKAYNKMRGTKTSPEALDEIAVPIAKQITEDANQKIDVNKQIEEEKVADLIKNNLNPNNLDDEVVTEVAKRRAGNYTQAIKKYDQSAEIKKIFNPKEQEEILSQADNVGRKIIDSSIAPAEDAKLVDRVKEWFKSIEKLEDVKKVRNKINDYYSEAPDSFYQRIGTKFKPTLDNIIEQYDKEYFPQAQKLFENAKKIDKPLGIDKTVTSGEKRAANIAELGNKSLAQNKNLNPSFAESFEKILKDKNFAGLKITTYKGMDAAVNNSIRKIVEKTPDLGKAANKIIEDIDKFKPQLQKYPELLKKYSNLQSTFKTHAKQIDILKDTKKLNEVNLNKYITPKSITQAVEEAPKESEDGVLLTILDGIFSIFNINVAAKKIFNALEYKIPNAKKRVNKIVEFYKNDEKLQARLLTENLIQDLTKITKEAEEIAQKGLDVSNGKIKKILERAAATSMFNEEEK